MLGRTLNLHSSGCGSDLSVVQRAKIRKCPWRRGALVEKAKETEYKVSDLEMVMFSITLGRVYGILERLLRIRRGTGGASYF